MCIRDSGYTEMNVPILVKDQALFGTGNLPKFSEDLLKSVPLIETAIMGGKVESGLMQKIGSLFGGNQDKNFLGLLFSRATPKLKMAKVTKKPTCLARPGLG